MNTPVAATAVAGPAPSALGMEAERRRVVGALFVSLLVLWGAFEAQPVFVDALLHAYGWSHAQVSWIAVVTSLGIGVAGPVAGQLLDRYDARYVMSFGAVLVGAGALLSSLTHGFAPLVAATAVFGVGLGAATVMPASLVVSNWFDHHRRATAIGFTLTGMEVGGMALTFASGLVIALGGWRAGFVLIGAPAILVAAPLLWALVRTRPMALAAPSGAAGVAGLAGLELRQAARTPVFWGLAGVQTASGLLIGAVFPFLVSYMITLGWTPGVAVGLVTASYGAVIVGKPVIGALADRLGARTALLIGFGAWAMVAVGLASGSRNWSAGLFVGFVGLALPAAIAIVPAVIARSLGLKRFGAIYGWLAVGNTAGLSLGPLVIGVLADAAGGYPAAFRVLFLFAALGAVSALACGGRVSKPAAEVAHG